MNKTPASALSDAHPPTTVVSAITDAMDTCLMRVECGLTRGFSGLQMLGNTSEVCRDGKERARAALERLGIHLPPQRLVLSLTPADLKKDGNHFDLPIAVSLALLIVAGQRRLDPSRWMFAAELGIAGELRPVKGIVSFAVAAIAEGLDGIVVASDNLAEVVALQRLGLAREHPLQVLAFRSLGDVLAWLIEGMTGDGPVSAPGGALARAASAVGPDFDDMILQPHVELAALVAAAGMHSLLLRGSPGTGKSMLAARLPSILPELSPKDHVEAMRIHSTHTERLPDPLLGGRPPYRAPHHQASAAAVLGSGEMPGEISLAHGGVLFLDELTEFRRDLLESLREPLETGCVHVSRSRRKAVWSARIILVAACNNCPCGWFGSSRRRCTCGSSRRAAYWNRLSGPILDRIDVQVNMPEPDDATATLFLRLAHSPMRSKTKQLATLVQQARARAAARNTRFGVIYNRDLAAPQLVAASGLAPEEFARAVNAVFPRAASSRAALRALRVARTLADLGESDTMRSQDIEQAWAWQAEAAARQRGEML